jgi:hypothetical protein
MLSCYHVGRTGKSEHTRSPYHQSASNLDRADGIQGDHIGAGRRDGITRRSYGAKDATYEPRCFIHPSTRDVQQCDFKCLSVEVRLDGHLHPALGLRQERGQERAVWNFDAATASLVRSQGAHAQAYHRCGQISLLARMHCDLNDSNNVAHKPAY